MNFAESTTEQMFLISFGALVVALLYISYRLFMWRTEARQHRHEYEEERKRMEKENMAERIRQKERMQIQELLDRLRDEYKTKGNEYDAGGYMVVDMPDKLRGGFTDLLRAFEDYARLKGYSITFSVDNSVPNS